MNNSKLAQDFVIDLNQKEEVIPKITLQIQEQETVKIIEALRNIQQSRDWSTLKEKIFDRLVTTIEKQLREEAKKESPDTLKLNRLAGQLKWAEKYSDLSKLEEVFKVQLKGIRQKLNG